MAGASGSASPTTTASLDLPFEAMGRREPFVAPAALGTDVSSPSLQRAPPSTINAATTCDYICCCCIATICPCAVVERVAWDIRLPGVFSCGFIAAIVLCALIVNAAFAGTPPDPGLLTVLVILSLIVGFWGGIITTSAIWLLLASQDGWRRPLTECAATLIVAVLALSILVTIIQILWRHRQQRESMFLMEIVFACCCPCCSVLTIAAKTTTGLTASDTLPAYAAS